MGQSETAAMGDTLNTTANIAQIIQAVPVIVAVLLYFGRSKTQDSSGNMNAPASSDKMRYAIMASVIMIAIAAIISSAALTEKLGWWPSSF
jgi:hypothetical protein